VYGIGSAKQASDFVIVTKYLINHIKKTYVYGDDIASALESRSPYDFTAIMPVLQVSSDTDPATKAREDKQFEILYKAEIDSFVQRKSKYDSNLGNAYAFLFGQCNKAMQNKLQARKDYDNKIKNQAIELLKAIEEHSISYQENKYEMAIIADAMSNLVNLKQGVEEPLIDYTGRFKSARDILQAQIGGPVKLTKVVKEMKLKAPSVSEEVLEKQAFEQLMTFIYIKNADRNKYGSVIIGLATQFSLDNNQYPKTITIANSVLSNHKFDAAYSDSLKKRREKQRDPQERATQEQEQSPELSFAQMENRCYCCGKANHKSPDCRDKDKPRSEWAINKTPEIRQVNHMMSQASQAQGTTSDSTIASSSQASASTTEGTTESPAERPTTWSWMATQVSADILANYKQEMRWWYLLDTESTHHFFCNPELVDYITTTEETFVLPTMAGELTSNQQGRVLNEKVWFNEEAFTNIFSMALLSDKFRITFDSEIEDAMIVHMPHGPVKFIRWRNLYYHKPMPSASGDKVPSFYSRKQIARADRARQFYFQMGCLHREGLEHTITSNAITNCPVTIDDLDLADMILGKMQPRRPGPSPEL
jgi:hypothetical protein